MVRHQKPPSQSWRTFLAHHMKNMVSSDFFVVPTVFFRTLFLFVILSHDRRRPVHVSVTEYPTGLIHLGAGGTILTSAKSRRNPSQSPRYTARRFLSCLSLGNSP